jgi:predicted transcriptional regulator
MKKRTESFDDYVAEQLKDPAFAAVYEEEKGKVDVAIRLLQLRTNAGLSQKQLADRLGTTQSAIARMENRAYTGYSLRMLRRIAHALGHQVQIEFVPARRPTRGAGRRNGRKKASGG